MSDELKSLLLEQLSALGPVAARRMFSGAGLFLDGLMFCLIARDAAYFKVDDANRPAFVAEGMQPFSYARAGREAQLTSYWRIPDRLLDEPDELIEWARAAAAVARRKALAPPKRQPTRKARRKA